MDKSNISFLGYLDNIIPDASEYENTLTQKNGFKIVPLRDLIMPFKSPDDEGYSKGRKYLPETGDLRRCFFKSFRYGYLRPVYNTIRPVYTADDITLTCNARQFTSNHYYILDRATLIFDSSFSRPVLFIPSKGIACINTSFTCFHIKTEYVNPFYLINELVKDYVEEQINELVKDYIEEQIKTNKEKLEDDFSIDDLLSVLIYIPDCRNSLERQRQIYIYEKQIMVAELFKTFNIDIDSMSNTDASALLSGCIVGNGRYRILSVIDSGGFSFTYKAIDTQDNKEIAIKEFFIRGLHTRNNHLQVVPKLNSKIEYLKKARDKFWMESDKIKEFSHCHNIVEVYDLFDENGTCYYTMEYINGCDLFYYVKSIKKGFLTEDEALDIIKNVCEAVGIMHDGMMNHLDIKPENIMIELETKRIVLIDFGTAAQYDDGESSILNCYSNGYTPPEYLSITGFCPQKDIYSIGATLYFLLSGENPPSSFDLLDGKTCLKRPEHISNRTWNIITSSMQYNYSDRPSSINDLKL